MADNVAELPDEILADFISWCEQNDLKLSAKVKVVLQGSCHRYGMIAVEDIGEGECLFEIPRALVLQPKTSFISKIVEKLTREDELDSERGSGWAPLLLTLMYEYTNSASHWKPYLNLVPDITILDQPMFWGAKERQRELKGTGIEEDVEDDVQRIEEEYKTIALPFIKKHPQYFSESCHTLALYKHMAAFVMAYSFTEHKSSHKDDHDDHDDHDDDEQEDNEAGPAMVPMADILNHISNNNAHLEFGAETLTMVAIQDIQKGQEIFNTYGKLANCHLLQSYGFVEDELPNTYDMIEMPISAFIEVMKNSQSQQKTGMLKSKLEFIEEMGVASEDDMFLFGREGCSHFGPDLYATLRILHLSEEQFKQLLEEQLRQKRSEEFDDIGHVLDQIDDGTRRDTSWRILQLVFEAENKRAKKKRKMNEKDSQRNQKKMKKPARLNRNLQSDNSSLECNKTEIENELIHLSKKDTDTNINRTSHQDSVEGDDGAIDIENSGKEKMMNADDGNIGGNRDFSDDHGNNENDNNELVISDGDDDAGDDVKIDDDDDDNDDDDDDDEDDDDDVDDDEGTSDDDVDDQEESEQPLTYDDVPVANRMEKNIEKCCRVLRKAKIWRQRHERRKRRREAKQKAVVSYENKTRPDIYLPTHL